MSFDILESGKKVKSHKKERICKFGSCGKKLSMYNGNKYCFIHVSQGCISEIKFRYDRAVDLKKKNYLMEYKKKRK